MIWIRRGIIIIDMTAITGVGGIGIITSDMTVHTVVLDRLMRSRQWIEGVMVKSRWYPGRLRMTIFAGGWEQCCLVIRIRRGIIIILVATHTGGRGIVVIAVMTGCAIVRYLGMRSIQLEVSIVVREGRWCPIWCRRMAGLTSCR